MTQQRKSRSLTFGVILMVVGFLILFDRMGVLDFGEVVSTYWPLILVIIGLRVILFPKEPEPQVVQLEHPEPASQPETAEVTQTSILDEQHIFGDVRRRISSLRFAGGKCSVVFGDIDIHAEGIELEPGQRTLYLNCVFGDIRLRLPDTMPMLVRANTAAGDIDIKGIRGEGLFVQRAYKSSDFESASTRLIVVASILFGDIIIW